MISECSVEFHLLVQERFVDVLKLEFVIGGFLAPRTSPTISTNS